jgi:membrane protein
LLWIYYSAQILFLGAEFTKVFSYNYGVQPEPKAHARWISPQTKPGLMKPTPGRPTTPHRPLETKEILMAQLRDEVDALRAAKLRLSDRPIR